MARKQFNIEVKFSSDDDTAFNTIKFAVIAKARELMAVAQLVCAGHEVKPTVNCYSDNFYEGMANQDLSGGGATDEKL